MIKRIATEADETVESAVSNEQILAELQRTNELLAEMIKQGGATDWKLWIIMNGVCDALLAQGLVDDDPRLAVK